jgi:hypothetical protein
MEMVAWFDPPRAARSRRQGCKLKARCAANLAPQHVGRNQRSSGSSFAFSSQGSGVQNSVFASRGAAPPNTHSAKTEF